MDDIDIKKIVLLPNVATAFMPAALCETLPTMVSVVRIVAT